MALSALSICSCAAPPDATIDTVFDPCSQLHLDVDDSASAAERASVRAALSMWNDDAATALTLDEGDGDGADDGGDGDAEAQRLPLHFDPAGTAFHGYYDDEAGVVYINERIRDDRARMLTVAHELGHAFGLHHVDSAERASLMNEGNTTVEVTGEDVAALEALWGACERAR